MSYACHHCAIKFLIPRCRLLAFLEQLLFEATCLVKLVLSLPFNVVVEDTQNLHLRQRRLGIVKVDELITELEGATLRSELHHFWQFRVIQVVFIVCHLRLLHLILFAEEAGNSPHRFLLSEQ